MTVLAAITLFILGFKGQYLLLQNEQSGKVLFCGEAADGERFSVSYIHSVNKSPVTEYYQIQSSEIYLTELRYKAFGAGMPTHPEENQTQRYEDGNIVVEGFARQMPYLCYSIGRIAEHTLHFREKSIPLKELDAPGQPVLFSVIVYPRVLMLLNIYPK